MEAETQAEYEELCEYYVECLGAWFDVLAASLVGGKAEEKAEEMAAAGKQDGKQLEDELNLMYEKKSNKNMAGLFLNWITTEKPHDVPTEEWTPKWNTTRKITNKNMDWPTIQTYIYIHEVTRPYKQPILQDRDIQDSAFCRPWQKYRQRRRTGTAITGETVKQKHHRTLH